MEFHLQQMEGTLKHPVLCVPLCRGTTAMQVCRPTGVSVARLTVDMDQVLPVPQPVLVTPRPSVEASWPAVSLLLMVCLLFNAGTRVARPRTWNDFPIHCRPLPQATSRKNKNKHVRHCIYLTTLNYLGAFESLF